MTLVAALIRVGAGLGAAALAGAAVSAPFTRGLTRRERAAWSLACGLLLQAFALLVLLAAGARPGAWNLLLLEGLAAAAGWALGRRFGDTIPSPRRAGGPGGLVVLLSAVAAAAWLVFLVGSLADSMWATDFLAFWGHKAKVVSLTGEIPRRLFDDPALDFAHPEYPLLVSLTLAGLASFAGEWNDRALALLYPVCALATLLGLFGFLERRVSRLAGAGAAALTALGFSLYRPANVGTAEVPLALGLVLVSCAAGDALRGMTKANLARLAIAAFFCAAVKQEGTLFVVLVAATLAWALRGENPRSRRWAVVSLLAPLAIHWVALHALRGSPPRRDFDFSILEPRRWAELPGIVRTVAERLVVHEALPVLPALAAIGVYFLTTGRGLMDPLLAALGAQLLCYAIEPVFAVDPLFAIDSAFSRIVMTLFPAFALVLCARTGLLTDDRGASPAGLRMRPTT